MADEWAKHDDPDTGRYTASEAFERAAKMVEADPFYKAGLEAIELWRQMAALENVPMGEAIEGGMKISQRARPLLAAIPKEG